MLLVHQEVDYLLNRTYNKDMKISYDPNKNQRNIEERGLSFEIASELDWATANIIVDERKDYGEKRYQIYGYIEERLYVAIFTPRADKVHIISLRKANKREMNRYG